MNPAACIVGSHDDPKYLVSIHFLKEVYYYFIKYFVCIRDKENAVASCITQIDNIFLSILWRPDYALGNNAKNSYFLKAVSELSFFYLSGK